MNIKHILFFISLSLYMPLVYSGTITQSSNSIIDNTTGLQWLDLNATQNMTYIQAQQSTFVQNEGYRVATASELDTLVSDYLGYGVTGSIYIGGTYQTFEALLGLMGSPSPSSMTIQRDGSVFFDHYFQAFTSTSYYDPIGGFDIMTAKFIPLIGHVAALFDDYYRASIGGKITEYSSFADQYQGISDQVVLSTFLVRNTPNSAVPEPETIIMFAIGLLGIATARKRA